MVPTPTISPDQARAELQRRRAVGSFAEFVESYNQGPRPLMDYEHVPRLVDVAERVCKGYLDRVLVLLPPRYFKSELFSRLLPAYYLRRYPTRHIGLASYSATLAWDLSGRAREYYEAAGGETARDTDAKREWANTHGGGMWADGVGGSLTGKGFHLGVIDDPMKPKHVRSRAYVEAFRSWYPETWYNRQEPGAAMILVMQRLGDDDPIDFLLRREVGDDAEKAPEHWHVVCCDEIKEGAPLGSYDGPRGLPSTCTLEPDPRPVGTILAPSRFDRAAVDKQQQAAGLYGAAQRQQRPQSPQGDFWSADWFRTYGTPTGDPHEELPDEAYNGGKDWDTAYTKDERNSASAYVESFRAPGKDCAIYITACGYDWLETPELVGWMRRVGGPHHVEDKAAGKSVVSLLRREGINAKEVTVQGGDKLARAADVQPIASAARVHVHASVKHTLLKGDRQGLLRVTAEQLASGSGELDLNDAFVQALQRHTSGNDYSSLSSSTPNVN